MPVDDRLRHAFTAGENVPAVLRRFRNYYGANDAQLARLTGIKRTTLANKLRGQGAFSPGEMRALAEVFDVRIETLYLPPDEAMRRVLDSNDTMPAALRSDDTSTKWYVAAS